MFFAIPLPTLLAFAVVCAIAELTPGPNMAWLSLVSASQGRRVGFAAVAGVCLGLAVVGLAAALGLAAIIANSSFAYEVLRWAGIGYFLYLAWEAWPSANEARSDDGDGTDASGAFQRGLITNLLNPKAGVFFVAILPSFVEPGGNISAQTIVLSMVFVVIATFIHAAIVALAGFARPWLADPQRLAPAKRLFAVTLAGIAFWLWLKH